MLTHHWKDLLMDFITGISISIDWKGDSYNSIFVIIDQLTKIVFYKPVIIIINTASLLEIIIVIMIRHYKLPNLIITSQELLFILKFLSILCYFLGIKQTFSTTFYSQTDGQTKKQHSTIEA